MQIKSSARDVETTIVILDSRIRNLNNVPYTAGEVLYWMSRDQRVQDNWALVAAQEFASEHGVSLCVSYVLDNHHSAAQDRQMRFIFEGLREVEQGLLALGIPFAVLRGDPETQTENFARLNDIGVIFTDFSPLRTSRSIKEKLVATCEIPIYEVDAHNIIPCWIASPKQEVGAYTLRSKIAKLEFRYLDEFPALAHQEKSWTKTLEPIDWDRLRSEIGLTQASHKARWFASGESHAHAALADFASCRLHGYSVTRNIPGQHGQSELSPYLHFGQIAPQRVALAVLNTNAPAPDKDSFLDELIVRRELADNFCHYNANYDALTAAPMWAQQSLAEHAGDVRDFVYTREEFENALTHDPLWNAAQREMVFRGKMHGYMRMYWAKKILEWTENAESALEIAIFLNDKYSLDGCDPNGYSNILWSVAGLHDRPWFERPVYGKIRYMNYNGCKRKFDIDAYIRYVDSFEGEPAGQIAMAFES